MESHFGGNLMEKKRLRPALRFFLACLILVAATPLISVIVNFLTIVAALTNAGWIINIIYFAIYIGIIITVFYRSSNRQNEYLASLDKDKEHTVKTDFLPFIKSEGAEVMISYAIYAILCFVARYTIIPPLHKDRPSL